jgi:lincosamide nucleotidyltransferase A/C/D/E
MEAKTVVNLYKELQNIGIKIWLDGGWGVDALLEKQTRNHQDLDIIVEKKNLLKLKQYLIDQGYQNFPRDDTQPWNFVMKNNQKKLVDIHVIVFDEKGNGIYGPKENDVYYPADALTAKGKINGVQVDCLTPEYQIKSHLGYELSTKDLDDVKALKEKFNLK